MSAEGAAAAIRFADNFFTANKNGYGLEPSGGRGRDLPAPPRDAVRVHRRDLGEARRDAVGIGQVHRSEDRQAPIVNVYRGGLESHVKRGVHFAVCDLATNRLANFIARKTDANADAIYKELTTNAIGNAHFVAAGILAVNRAQERGYAVAYAG